MDAAQRRRYDAAYAAITRLCNRGLPAGDLFRQVSVELRKAVVFRTAGWLQLDPATLLPLPGLLLQANHDHVGRLIHNEYFEADVAKFRDLARCRVPVQTLWHATGGEPERSPRYRTMLRQMDYGDDLRVMFRRDAASWGAACLARTAADPPFSRDDVGFVARLGEPVAHGLRLSLLLAGAGPAASAPPGVVILSEHNDVVSLSDAAQYWLAQLPVDDAPGLDLPAAILSAASQARALAAGEPDTEFPGGRIRTTAGSWLRIHATHMTPGPDRTGQIAVILEPARPADLSALVLDLHGLTSREQQITQLLLRGLPTRQIAQALFISRHTLSDHLKAIFAKLRVTSRPELTALLLDHAQSAPATRRPTDRQP